MLSRAGRGPLLLWPFTTASWLLPWRPIPGTESALDYLTPHAIPTLLAESFLFSPFLVYTVWVLLRKRRDHAVPRLIGPREEAASRA